MKALFVAVNAKYVHTNIAVRYLTRSCETKGIDCGFCEFTINEPRDGIIEKLYMSDCDVYGFSCYIWNVGRVLELCQNLKQLKPKCTIILGGPEVSFDAEKLLLENEFIDFVVCGEGELVIPELLRNIPDERKIIHGRKSETMEELPFPYTDEDLEEIVKGEKLVYYETSRGCPFSCAYCLSSVDQGVRFLNLDRVKAELKKFVDAGVMTVKFVDRTFNADRCRALEIWKYCLELGGETCFHFEIGADLIDKDAIEVLKAAPRGKFQFEIGVQSTNGQTISEISRTMNLDVLERNVKELREKTHVMLHLDLIAGLPYEDFDTFKKSFNQVYNMNPHVLQLGFLKLLKGSALRKNSEEYGILYNCFAPYEVFSTRWLSYEDVIKLKGVEDVLERYFNSGRFYETLDKVMGFFETPFDFYYRLSQFWANRGLIGQGVKRITLYQLLYEFLKEELSQGDTKLVISVMKKDFAKWHSNGVGTPDWYKINTN